MVNNLQKQRKDEIVDRIANRKKISILLKNKSNLNNNDSDVELDQEDDLKNSNVNIDTIARVENEIYRDKLKHFLNHKYTNLIFMFVSIYSLFADDIRLVASYKSADPVFSTFAILVFLIFSVEIILTFLIDERYICGLYFWIDLVSTLSMLLDVHWIYDSIYELARNDLSVALKQIGRGGRVAARAFRLLRFMRTLKLMTIEEIKKLINEHALSKYLKINNVFNLF
jgi:hypothetical protein